MSKGMNSVNAFAASLDYAEKLGGKVPPTWRRISTETKKVSTVTGKAASELWHYGDQFKKTSKEVSNYGDNFKNSTEKSTTPTIRAYENLVKKIEESKIKANSSMANMSSNTSKSMSNMSSSVGNYALSMHNSVVGKFNAINTAGKTQMSDMSKSVIGFVAGMSSGAKDNTSSMATSVSNLFASMKSGNIDKSKSMATNVVGMFKNMKSSSNSETSFMSRDVQTTFMGMSKNSQITSAGMKNSIVKLFQQMKSGSSIHLESMSTDMSNKFVKMSKNSKTGGTSVKDSYIGAVAGVRKGSNEKWNGVEDDTGRHITNSRNKIANEKWNPLGFDLVEGLRIGLEKKWNNTGPEGLIGGIIALARGLTSALKRAFGIHSPSRLWNKEIGQFLPPGIGLGMESAMPKLLSDASGMATDLTSAFNTSLQFTDPLQDLADMSADIASSINTDVATSTSTVIDTGRMSTDIASGIVDGMSMSQADQNRLLREQNELLRQLLAKDTGISSNDIFESVKRSNRQAFNRTGKNPLVY